jgi:tryptophanyl-tRNA synthetase
MKTVFSGIQSSGNLHLGNYLGSIANWIDLQNHNHCIFGIMDLHAITTPQDPKELAQNIIEVAICYLASGLDPEKSIIFQQSKVSQHLELAWAFACITPLGWLNRMTQFKEKALKQDENTNLGLLSYPVLMAADILLYKTDLVPVGEDQKQHLELTRDLAGAFNRKVGIDYFKLPEPMIIKGVERIMSLTDGTKKMSKSEVSDYSRINLTDSAEEIVKKIKKCKTDSTSLIAYDETRPEIYNLLNIFAAVANKKPEEIAKEYENSGYGKFKTDLAEAIVAKLSKISQNIKHLKNDIAYVNNVLIAGNEKASDIASKTKNEVFNLLGL